LRYIGKELSITLLDFNVFSYSKGEDISFRVDSPHLKVIFPLSSQEVKIEGDLKSEFINKKKVFKINKFRWATKDIIFTGNGNIYRKGNFALHIFSNGDVKNILYPIIGSLAVKGNIKGKTTIVKDISGNVKVNGSFIGQRIRIADEEFSRLRSSIRWNNQSKKIKINSSIVSDGLLSSLRIISRKEQTNIEIANIYASKAARVIDIYNNIPLGGLIKKCNLKIIDEHISGNVKVEKKIGSDEEFNAEGIFDFEYDTSDKWIKFKTNDAESEFGKVDSLKGLIDPKNEVIKIDMIGKIREVSGADKYLKKYVDLDLKRWKLRNGKGDVTLSVLQMGNKTEVKSNLNIKNFTSNGVHIESLISKIHSINNKTDVDFTFNDPKLRGDSHLVYEKGRLDINFNNVNGETSEIFRILDYDIGLKGRINGSFSFHSEDGMNDPLIKGKYASKKLNFHDFIFENVSGEIEVLDSIILKNTKFHYHKGEGSANILLNFEKKYFDIEGDVKSVDIKSINEGFSGKANFYFSGKGKFNVDPINIKFEIPNVCYYSERTFGLFGTGKILTDFSDFIINAQGKLKKNGIESPLEFVLGLKKNKFYGSLDVDLKDINIIMPWENNKGSMQLRSEIGSDDNNTIHFQGVAELSGDFISFPGFPHTLDDFKGSLLFKDLDFTMRSFSGEMGGGKVTGNGRLKIEDNELKDLLVTFKGKNMFLFPMERANFRMNANLNLQKKKEKFVLGGTINFLSLLWEREVDEGISFYAGTGEGVTKKSTFLENLEFDILMAGRNNIKIRNSLIRGNGEVDLALTGSTDFPVLSGSVSSRNGEVLISGREFNIVKAKIIFSNKVRIDPLIRLEAETFIKNYRIKFLISGFSSGVRPEFISSPPLPQQDIIALISLGELFRRSSSTNISSEVGTTGLITTALTDQIQKRVKKLFGIDMLKIDPDPTRSSLSGAARLTIGKSITKDFLIVYSTDISKSTRDVYYFQYQITPTISLIGKRNEEGRLSLDIRFRKRY